MSIPFSIRTFLLVLFLFGCAREYSFEGGAGTGNPNDGNMAPVPAEWEFTEAGTRFSGPVDTAFLTKQDNGEVLNVTGRSTNGQEKIDITITNLTALLKKGETYSTSQQQVTFRYMEANGNALYAAVPYEGGDIYVTITDLDSNKVKGTFKGLVKKNNTGSYQLTEGKFSSPLKTIPLSEAKGYIMLWANQGCNGPVKVKVNNQPGEITVFSWVAPDCGDSGRATYQLPPGTYNWVAYCGKDSVTGQALLKPGFCTRVLLAFPFMPPDTTLTETDKTCKVSYVSYSSGLIEVDPNSVTATITGNKVTSLLFTQVFKSGNIKDYVTIPHPVSYAGNKVIIDEGTPDEQYFVTNAQGNVVEYVGFNRPEYLYTRTPVHILYAYDSNNHLVKRTTTNSTSGKALLILDFKWLNGNMVHLKESYPPNGAYKIAEYDYYTNRTVTAMPFYNLTCPELVLFQSIINMGTPTVNPPKTEYYKTYNPSGGLVFADSLHFKDYIIDDNNYVQALYYSHRFGKYNAFGFKYTCF